MFKIVGQNLQYRPQFKYSMIGPLTNDLWKYRAERFKGKIFTEIEGIAVLLVLVLLAFAFWFE